MPRCGRQGTCMCNDAVCFTAQQWWLFCMSWLSVAWAMTERTGHRRNYGFIQWLDEQDDAA